MQPQEARMMDTSHLTTWIENVPLMQEGYHQQLLAKVDALRDGKTIYPPPDHVLYALEVTPFDAVKVVIVGQDPYHGAGQAHGLAFSVPESMKAPPSLRNIFKEIAQDVYAGSLPTATTDLSRWAEQGVLLLNASLTVEAGNAGSHSTLGWMALTDSIIASLSDRREHLVFMLWGRFAQSKAELIDGDRHLILEAAHPSPFSAHRGFFGCAHFSKANAYVSAHGEAPIIW
jgi:uracil-DNA glycosylase